MTTRRDQASPNLRAAVPPADGTQLVSDSRAAIEPEPWEAIVPAIASGKSNLPTKAFIRTSSRTASNSGTARASPTRWIGNRAAYHPSVLFVKGDLGFHGLVDDKTPDTCMPGLDDPFSNVHLFLATRNISLSGSLEAAAVVADPAVAPIKS